MEPRRIKATKTNQRLFFNEEKQKRWTSTNGKERIMETSFTPSPDQASSDASPDVVIVDAIYSPRDEDLDVDNPLIRALPPYVSAESVLVAFRNGPDFSISHRRLSANSRVHRISSLRLYVEPLTCHPILIESIFRLITAGYAWRNPRDKTQILVRARYAESMNGSNGSNMVTIIPPRPAHEAGLALFGVSGVGKTTSLNRTLSFLPQVIRHAELSGSNLQVVWIKVDCPPDGSIKQLFHWMLLEYDRVLGTHYDKELGNTVRLDQLMNKVAAVAKYHHTGIIVIDEIQFAASGAARRGDPFMNFFVTFTNLVRVPLLIAGTPKALSLFEKSFRLARRSSDQGAIIFTNMAFDEEWEFFLKQLFKYQWIRKPRKFNKELSATLYELTQGIHALVVRLFQLAQIAAIRTGSERLSTTLLRTLARDRFGPVQPMMDALRSKKKRRIELYDDLLVEMLAGLDEEIRKQTESAKVMQAATQRQRNSVQLIAVSDLIAMGVPQSQALTAVIAALTEDDSLTGEDLVRAACEKAGITMESPHGADPEEQQSLPDIVRDAKSPEEALEMLRQAGWVVGDTKR
ncbi:ATP-binding protein [Paraburkholderia phymatum]|nr:ATP-binding protein [Paraburkholderia phymatum]